MVSHVSQVLSAYSNALARGSEAGMAPREQAGASFAELLKEAGQTAVDTLKHSEALTAEAVVGRADLLDVVQAVNDAETTLRTVTAVRDRVITAYQEIMRMPI